MFNFLKKEKQKNLSEYPKILEMMDDILDLKIAMKEVRNDLTKMDIRILENQKNYQTKLLRLVQKEEKVEPKEEKKDINSSVFLIE